MNTIDEIRARTAEITPGQWRALISQEFDGDWIVTTDDMAADLDSVCVVGAPGSPRVDNDAEFIAHAPDDIRHLLAALDAAQARASELERALRQVRDMAVERLTDEQPNRAADFETLEDIESACDRALGQ